MFAVKQGTAMLNNRRFPLRFAQEKLEDRNLLDGSGAPSGEPVDEFALIDVNETSPSFNELVSPEQFDGQTTAWYLIRSW